MRRILLAAGVLLTACEDPRGQNLEMDAASTVPDADVASAPPALAWAVRFGGVDKEYAEAVAVDPLGDVYVAGYSQGSFTAGTTVLANQGGLDGFVMRLRGHDGSVVWARPVGGPGEDWVRSLVIAPDGDVVLLGDFQETIDLGTGPVTAASSNGFAIHDLLVAKLAAADGAAVWVKRLGGTGFDGAGDLVVREDGSVCVGGCFSQMVDFGGGPIGTNSNEQPFVACFSGVNGSYLWAHPVAESVVGTVMGVALTSEGDPITSAFGRPVGHAFVGRYAASDGTERWSSELLSTGLLELWRAATDGRDVIYAVGTMAGTLTFAGQQHVAIGTDPIMLTYSADGTPRALLALDGDGEGEFEAVTASTGDELTAVASVSGTFIVGDSTYVTTGTGTDTLVIRFDRGGSVRWSEHFGGDDVDIPTSVRVADDGSVVLAGGMSSSVDFDGTLLTSAGSADIFVARLAPPAP